MRKEISEKIEIPTGIEVEVFKDSIKFKKDGREIIRKYSGFEIKKQDNALILCHKQATKKEKKLINSIKSHIQNALAGLEKKFVYKLQVCSVHFPMSVSVDKAKSELVIKNFLGGVKPRVAKILENVDVKVEKDAIAVESHDKEKAGQTAANIEKATKVRNKDRRVFQDSIVIIKKPE